MQKFVLVLEGNLSVKNAQKLSAKYLQDKKYKTKQMQNIPLTLRTFLNQLKMLSKNVAPKRTPLTLLHLRFSAKFVTERTFIVAMTLSHG